jgi:diguanylate cyclase (GGDEF)-like protein
MMHKKSGRLRILIVHDNELIHKKFKHHIHSQPRPSFYSRLKNIFKKKIPQQSLFEIHSAYDGDDAMQRVTASLAVAEPYAVVFIAVDSDKNQQGLKTLATLWEKDKNFQAVLCTDTIDSQWERKIAKFPVGNNYMILKNPHDGMSVRQLAHTLAHKWQLENEKQLHNAHFEDHIKDRVSELNYQAHYDVLTALPNRTQLLKDLNELIVEAKKADRKLGIFFFDLDRFKLINDGLTHTIGDEVLKAVAERLQAAAVEYKHILGRFGGDEFILIIDDIKSESAASAIVKSLSGLFHKPFSIVGRRLNITSSIGVAFFPKDGSSARELFSHADIAMYVAKARGNNSYQFYESSLNMDVLKRLDFETELSQAIEMGQFVLHYQPEFNLVTGVLEGAEALMRWQHPERGLIMPEEFISIAEETGLIVPMGEWVLRAACRQNKIWQESHLPQLRMAVNVAGLQFEHPGFVDLVKNILQDSGLSASYLELEITENVIIKNNKFVNIVHELKNLGTRIALDDFGSGYSNINYLRKLPIDRLKIDRTYIQNIRTNAQDEAIIRTVIAMANAFNLQVLAEGVETPDQLNFLKEAQCHEGQGFYFSKPLSVEEFELFLNSYKQPTLADVEAKK